MLKSKRVGDHYHNVNLSNLKILSTTRNTCSGVSERYLQHIDETIRDIEALNWEGEKEVDKKVEEEIIPETTGWIQEVTPEKPSTKPEKEIPILLSIQYNNYHDVIGAVEGFIKESHHTYQPGIIPTNTCSMCACVEIVHSEKLAQLSAWRKNVMTQLNLQTTAYID